MRHLLFAMNAAVLSQVGPQRDAEVQRLCEAVLEALEAAPALAPPPPGWPPEPPAPGALHAG